MNRTALMIALCIAPLPATADAQVSAEPWFSAGTWMLTMEFGGAAFTDFQRSQARPVGDTMELGDFTRRVSAQTASSVGGWVSYWLRDGLAVRAGLSYVPSSFTVWNDEVAQQALDRLDPERIEPAYASLGIWMANASAVIRIPHRFGRVVPYAMVGGGIIRYRVSDDAAMPPEARSRFADGELQSGAAMFGVGAAIPLQRRNLLMTFELTNHVARTPLGDPDEGEMFEISGVPMQINAGPQNSGDDGVGVTSHFRLAVGLTLPLR